MTLTQRAALISSDAHALYRRLDNLQKEYAPLDRERADEAARRIIEQMRELVVQFEYQYPSNR
jgi:hypothetical protein